MSWEDRIIEELIREEVREIGVATWAEDYINNNGF